MGNSFFLILLSWLIQLHLYILLKHWKVMCQEQWIRLYLWLDEIGFALIRFSWLTGWYSPGVCHSIHLLSHQWLLSHPPHCVVIQAVHSIQLYLYRLVKCWKVTCQEQRIRLYLWLDEIGFALITIFMVDWVIQPKRVSLYPSLVAPVTVKPPPTLCCHSSCAQH